MPDIEQIPAVKLRKVQTDFQSTHNAKEAVNTMSTMFATGALGGSTLFVFVEKHILQFGIQTLLGAGADEVKRFMNLVCNERVSCDAMVYGIICHVEENNGPLVTIRSEWRAPKYGETECEAIAVFERKGLLMGFRGLAKPDMLEDDIWIRGIVKQVIASG